MEFTEAWFSCFESKVINALSVLNSFSTAVCFLVVVKDTYNWFRLDCSIKISQTILRSFFNLDYLS